MYCIKEYLLNYEVTGGWLSHDKNVEIDELFSRLGFPDKRVFVIINNEKKENENEKKKKLNILKIIDIKPNIQKQEIIEEEKEKDPKHIQALKAKLTSILSE